MPNETLSVNYSVVTSTSGDVILEQLNWDKADNSVTKLDLVHAMSDYLYNTSVLDASCIVDSKHGFDNILYAYPDPDDLSFQVGITYGSLSEGVSEIVTVSDKLDFSLVDKRTLNYPSLTEVDYEWLAAPWGVAGEEISPPSVTVSGREVKLSKAVYGSLMVTYTTYRVAYSFYIVPREDSVENVYSSWAWVRWDGGTKLLQLQSPEGAENNYLNDTTCTSGGRVRINTPGLPEIPKASATDLDIDIDYCSQKEIV